MLKWKEKNCIQWPSAMTNNSDSKNLFLSQLRKKVFNDQEGIPTFFDNFLHGYISNCDKEHELNELRDILFRTKANRFISYFERISSIKTVHKFLEQSPESYLLSQGMGTCMQWKGMPLFKTLYDFAIYSMMVQEVMPKTILEFGSGSGTSAIWLADLMVSSGIEGCVYSIDINKIDLQHDRVKFIKADCQNIDENFLNEYLASLPHPWLVIDDVHVNTLSLLLHVDRYLTENDYLIIEDSVIPTKNQSISKFVADTKNTYMLDCYYLDFFGINATSAKDAIFKKTSKEGE